jgi:hypothetical protein
MLHSAMAKVHPRGHGYTHQQLSAGMLPMAQLWHIQHHGNSTYSNSCSLSKTQQLDSLQRAAGAYLVLVLQLVHKSSAGV